MLQKPTTMGLMNRWKWCVDEWFVDTSHKQCNKWCVWFEHISQCHSMCTSIVVVVLGFVRVETRDLLRDWWKQLWSHHETSRVTMVLVIKVTLNGFAPGWWFCFVLTKCDGDGLMTPHPCETTFHLVVSVLPFKPMICTPQSHPCLHCGFSDACFINRKRE